MIDTRVEIRAAEGGYIVSLYGGGKSDIAMRQEVYIAKADALAAATRLHADGLLRNEQWKEQMERERAQYGQQNLTLAGQFVGNGLMNQALPISGVYNMQQERAR